MTDRFNYGVKGDNCPHWETGTCPMVEMDRVLNSGVEEFKPPKHVGILMRTRFGNILSSRLIPSQEGKMGVVTQCRKTGCGLEGWVVDKYS